MQTSHPPAAVSKVALWTGRVISGLIVLFMLLDGVMKLVKPEMVVKGSAEVGIPESTLVGIGITLLISVVLYAIPRTSVLGAILLTGYLGGAILTHVRVGGPVFSIVFASLFGILAWLGLFLRDRRLRELIPFRTPG